jgi:hypothetical protein
MLRATTRQCILTPKREELKAARGTLKKLHVDCLVCLQQHLPHGGPHGR